jgi:hypothetical protein
VSIGFVSGNPIYNRVVFGSPCSARLIIGSGYTCLCNQVIRVNPNPTRLPELPTHRSLTSKFGGARTRLKGLSRRWVLTGGLLTFDFGGAQQMVKYVVTGMTLEEEMGGDRPA